MVKKIRDAKVIFPDRASFPNLQYTHAVMDHMRNLMVRKPKKTLVSKRGKAEELEHQWFNDIDKD